MFIFQLKIEISSSSGILKIIKKNILEQDHLIIIKISVIIVF